jgi:hypothetical protein
MIAPDVRQRRPVCLPQLLDRDDGIGKTDSTRLWKASATVDR